MSGTKSVVIRSNEGEVLGYGNVIPIEYLASELWSWGYNTYGQLGLEDTPHRSSPVQVGALTTWNKIETGYYHVVASK